MSRPVRRSYPPIDLIQAQIEEVTGILFVKEIYYVGSIRHLTFLEVELNKRGSFATCQDYDAWLRAPSSTQRTQVIHEGIEVVTSCSYLTFIECIENKGHLTMLDVVQYWSNCVPPVRLADNALDKTVPNLEF